MAKVFSVQEHGRVEHGLQPHHVRSFLSMNSLSLSLMKSRCRCRAEFCYVCGARWKTCTCAQWDEHRLIDRAQVVVDRDPQPFLGGPAAAEQHRAAELRAVVDQLRDRHECLHRGQWRRIGGRHQCEECFHTLPDFILECPRCRIRACVRCKRNRL